MTIEGIEPILQALEERMMKQQNEKFGQVLALLGSQVDKSHKQHHQADLENKVSQLSERIDHLLAGENDTKQLLNQISSSAELEKKVDRLNDRIDHLLAGESDSTRILGNIVSSKEKNEKMNDKIYNFLREMDDAEEKFRKFYVDKLKDVMDEVLSTKSHVKEIERDVRDLREAESRSSESAKRTPRKDHSSRKKRKRSSESDRSRDSSTSTSHDRSRDSRSMNKKGCEELEKLMVQLNESIGVLSDRVEKTSSLGIIQENLIPQVSNISQLNQSILDRVCSGVSLPAAASSSGGAGPSLPLALPDDDDASPSPLRKHQDSDSDDEKAMIKKHKKKRRKRSDSSSSSDDSSEDERSHKLSKLDTKDKSSSIGFKLMDNRLTDMTKSFKKSLSKLNDSNKTVLKRVDQMAAGIQVIAENIDSMNDLRKDLEFVPKRMKNLDEKISNHMEELNNHITVVLAHVDGSKGRKLTSNEFAEVSNMLSKMEDSNSTRFCEFGGLVESLQEAIVRRMDDYQERGCGNKSDRSYIVNLLDISEKLIECVKSVERTQKKELLPGIDNLVALCKKGGRPEEPELVDDHQTSETGPRNQESKLLDGVVIKIMPKLENINSRMNRMEEKLFEDNQDQKILDILEDMRCEVGGVGKRVSGAPPLPPIKPGDNNNWLEKIEDIFSVVNDIRDEVLRAGSAETTKTLDTLLQNSNSDANLLSGLNLTMQSLKASVTGLHTHTAAARDSMTTVEKKMTEMEARNLDYETKLQTEIMSGFGSVNDLLRPYLEKMSKESPDASEAAKLDLAHLIQQLSQKLDKPPAIQHQEGEANNSISPARMDTAQISEVINQINKDVKSMGVEIKSQLDDVHDMVYSMEEKTVGAIDAIKTSFTQHDKTSLLALNNVGKIMKGMQEETKMVKEVLESDKGMKDDLVGIMESLNAIQGGDGKSKGGKGDHNLQQITNKIEKQSKIINRVKFLLEKDNDDMPVRVTKIKTESPPDLEQQIKKFQEAVEEDLTNQSDMITEMTNNYQELADKVSTKEALKAFTEDVRFRLSDISNGMTELKLKSGVSGGGGNFRELEDNLAAAVSASLRDDIKNNFDFMNDNLNEMETKLHGIKRLVSQRRGDDNGGNDAANSKMLERVEVVARRLESVQTALENSGGGEGRGEGSFNTALLLEEIRKRAESDSLDRLSQDLFKAMHNVQQRLLEELKRLISKFSTLQENSYNSSNNQLVEILNKVRRLQAELLTKKSSGVQLQETTNKLLTGVVDTLEKTVNTISGDNSNHMTRRMAELCDELSVSLNGLISVQKDMNDLGSLTQVDELLKTAASQLQKDALLPGGPDGDRYDRGDVSPASDHLVDNQGPHLHTLSPQGPRNRDNLERGGEVSDELLVSPSTTQGLHDAAK